MNFSHSSCLESSKFVHVPPTFPSYVPSTGITTHWRPWISPFTSPQVDLAMLHVAGKPESCAETILGKGQFTQIPAGRGPMAPKTNFIARDDSRMIAGNIQANTTIQHASTVHVHGYEDQQLRSARRSSIKKSQIQKEQRKIHKRNIHTQQRQGTGLWILEQSKISSWLMDRIRFLWLHGGGQS